jgi:hypothetical protein
MGIKERGIKERLKNLVTETPFLRNQRTDRSNKGFWEQLISLCTSWQLQNTTLVYKTKLLY